MKYCPKCKQRAKQEETVCARCGGELRVLGGGGAGGGASAAVTTSEPSTSKKTTAAPTSASPASANDEQLRLQLAGIQHDAQKSASRAKILAIVAAVLLLLLIVYLLMLRNSFINEFATVESVQFEPYGDRAGSVEITFRPQSAGKVEFTRESSDRQETLIEHIESTTGDDAERTFVWSGSESNDYKVHVRYRRGWGLKSEEWKP